MEQRKSWGQANHSLEDSGGLYVCTHFLGLDQLDLRAHNLELHSYYRRQVEPRKSWGQAKHSGVGGAALVLGVLGLACLGYALACVKDIRREAARRPATTLGILKTPHRMGGTKRELLEMPDYQ